MSFLAPTYHTTSISKDSKPVTIITNATLNHISSVEFDTIMDEIAPVKTSTLRHNSNQINYVGIEAILDNAVERAIILTQ